MKYLIRICNDDRIIRNIYFFGDEEKLISLVKSYLSANEDCIIEIYDNATNTLLHKYEMNIGTHNELKMYDLL